jgi:photosystem II core protein PsbZ
MFLFALSLSFVLTLVSSLLFKFLVVAFIAMSAIMTVGVPVVYTTVEDQEQVRSLIGRGSITWFALLVLVAVTTFFVA